ncbi:MAG TPA: tRNA pseudouridine(55) synthase TruB [Blastocatellia bacterium]|jgi:tRNA pseudouridine55 synthase|nr:tRNA pseudouridine(55) synthase TruB [Blastocatellia bacterium]
MDGAFIIDKPEGITSHDVVHKVRRAARMKRVGHSGTLDPFATGVLLVCVGRATRLSRFLVGLDKTYEARVRLGYATDTQDLTGERITPLATSNGLGWEEVRRALAEFSGPQMQTPPMFSAKKVAGERLYKAAREGREVEREPAAITVYSIEALEPEGLLPDYNEDGTRDFKIRVRCSSGTYIRTLAHDIGARLGVGAHLAALRRTAVGRFDLSSAVTLDDLEAAGKQGTIERLLIGMAEVPAHLPRLVLSSREMDDALHGRAIHLSAGAFEQARAGFAGVINDVRLCDKSGRLLGMGEYDEAVGTVKPRVVLSGEKQGM